MKILFLAGSPSLPSRSSRLLAHLQATLQRSGYACSSLQVRDLPAAALLHAQFDDPIIRAAIASLQRADAIVIATPIYKAAYSGILKAFLDLLAQDGLAEKLVLPLATGGSQSHMLALDYSLRPVLTALGARHVLPSIYATDAQVRWSPAGLELDAELTRRLDNGAEQLRRHLPLAPQREFERHLQSTPIALRAC